MDYIEWIRRVDRQEPGRLLLALVEEPFLWDSVQSVLQQDVLGGKFLAFNYQKLDATVVDPQSLIEAVETLPLMAERRILVIDHAPLRKDDLAKFEPILVALQDISQSAPAHVLIVLGFHGEKPFRGKYWKAMENAWERLDLGRLDQRSLTAFIEKRLRSLGVVAENGVVSSLIRSGEYLDPKLGRTLYDVRNLVDRVAALSKDGRLYLQEVEEALISPAERSIFKLMDAVNARDRRKALLFLRGYFDLGEGPFPVFYMLVRQIRFLLGVKRAEQRRLSARDAEARLGLSHFEYGKFVQGQERFTEEELVQWHDALYRMERRIKTEPFDLASALERFVLHL